MKIYDLLEKRAETIFNSALDTASYIFSNKIKNRYGYRVSIRGDYDIDCFNKWIKDKDPLFDKRPKNMAGQLEDCQFVINYDINTFILVAVGFNMLTGSEKEIKKLNINDVMLHTKIDVFIFGKKAKYALKDMESSIKRTNENLVIYNVSINKNGYKDEDKESFSSIVTDLKTRDIDSLFYEDDVKDEIINHIDNFFKSNELYETKSITYKTSLLLYGEPGTGKSSLAKALATKYNLNMILVDVNNFAKLDTTFLTSCINEDRYTYIVLLEDIDTVFNTNREREQTAEEKKIINKLLQFMDSNVSPSNVIFICTTNHLERLDPALLRAGRIDKKVYIGPLKKQRAIKMCESFNCSDDQIRKIISKFEDPTNINQSELQQAILDQFKNDLIEGE